MLMSVVASCKDSVPRDILPPRKMESLLYDYHMAQSVSANIPASERHKKEPYKNYVLEKHRVDEELFDSSMAWYSRHTSYMVDIYEKVLQMVTSRLETANDILRLRENKFIKAISADTADVWGGRNTYVLTTLPNSSLVMFKENIDTTFHSGDKIVFKARYQFPSDSLPKPQIITTIALTYSNDSTLNYSSSCSTNAVDSIVIETLEEQLKKLALSFFITPPADSIGKRAALVTDIEFCRYHKPSISNTSTN